MATTRRISKLIKITLLILSGIALFSGWQLYRWNQSASESFERHAVALSVENALPKDRTIHRPPLFEPMLEGDAWDSYTLLGPDLKGVTAQKWTLREPILLEEHERLIAASRPILEGLRQAFSKDRLTIPEPLEVVGSSDSSFHRTLMEIIGILNPISRGYHAQQKDADALDALILMLATASDLRRLRNSGVLPTSYAIDGENRAFNLWRTTLDGHCLSSSEFAGISAQLDRVFTLRASIHDHVPGHGLIWRQHLLDWERDNRSDFPFGERPSWRHAFSARLGRAAALDQTVVTWTRLRGLKDVPSHLWLQALETIFKEDGSIAIERHFEDVRSVYAKEVECLRQWTSARVAMAIARYEVDQGKFPLFLTDLSPVYLGTIPPCPEGGETWGYSAGSIWCTHSGSKWKVSRRK